MYIYIYIYTCIHTERKSTSMGEKYNPFCHTVLGIEKEVFIHCVENMQNKQQYQQIDMFR